MSVFWGASADNPISIPFAPRECPESPGRLAGHITSLVIFQVIMTPRRDGGATAPRYLHTPHPPSKKIGRPLPPTCCSAKKPVGPIDFKIGRGDHIFSITVPCFSTGVQARRSGRSDRF